jgi:CheY-like chemotaxis protein
MSKEKISILVAENSPPDIDIIKSTLGKYDDVKFTIDTAYSSADVLNKAVDSKFDLLLVNQDKRGTKGIKMLQEITKRKLGRR